MTYIEYYEKYKNESISFMNRINKKEVKEISVKAVLIKNLVDMSDRVSLKLKSYDIDRFFYTFKSIEFGIWQFNGIEYIGLRERITDQREIYAFCDELDVVISDTLLAVSLEEEFKIYHKLNQTWKKKRGFLKKLSILLKNEEVFKIITKTKTNNKSEKFLNEQWNMKNNITQKLINKTNGED